MLTFSYDALLIWSSPEQICLAHHSISQPNWGKIKRVWCSVTLQTGKFSFKNPYSTLFDINLQNECKGMCKHHLKSQNSCIDDKCYHSFNSKRIHRSQSSCLNITSSWLFYSTTTLLSAENQTKLYRDVLGARVSEPMVSIILIPGHRGRSDLVPSLMLLSD